MSRVACSVWRIVCVWNHNNTTLTLIMTVTVTLKAAEKAKEAVEEGTLLMSPRRHSSFDLSHANFAIGIDDADTPDIDPLG